MTTILFRFPEQTLVFRHLYSSIHGDNMISSCCKLSLENGRFVEVYTTKDNEYRVDLREWESDRYPSRKGISLKPDIFKTWTMALDMIDNALNKNEELHYHMGSNIFCTIKKDNPCVDIRQYWQPIGQEPLAPTKKGLCLRPIEYRKLKSHVAEIGKAIPDFDSLSPCFMRDDHLNQLGLLQCPTCNPLDYTNW